MSMTFTVLLSECSDASNDARSRFHVNKRKQGLEAPFIKDNCKQELCYVKPVCITESSKDGNLTGSKENKEDPESEHQDTVKANNQSQNVWRRSKSE